MTSEYVLFVSLFILLLFGNAFQDDDDPVNWPIIKKSWGGLIYWNRKTKMLFQCHEYIDINIAFRSLTDSIDIEEVTVDKCSFPQKPIVETFKALNINATGLKSLRLRDIRPFLPGNYTTGLKLHTLKIKEVKTDVFEHVRGEFFTSQKELTLVYVLAASLPSLPPVTQPYTLVLQSSWINNWDHCFFLKSLHISDLDHVPLKFQLKCPHLTEINIEAVPLQAMRFLLLSVKTTWMNLTSLTLSRVHLNELPLDVLEATKRLTYLDFARNNLNDESFTDFPTLPNLKYFSLERNSIKGHFLPDLVKKMPKLMKLILNKNKKMKCGPYPYLNMSALAEKSLSLLKLSVADTGVTISCFKNISFSKLSELDFYENASTYLMNFWNHVNLILQMFQLKDLPKSNSTHLKIDTRGQHLNLLFDYNDYLFLSYEKNISRARGHPYKQVLLLDKIYCNCQHYWLVRALHDFPNELSIPNLSCIASENLAQTFQNMNCYDDDIDLHYDLTVNDWNKGVSLNVKDSGNDVWEKVANLHYKVDSLRLVGIGNITIRETPLLHTLTELDVRDNNLNLDKKEAEILFSIPELRLWLGGNTGNLFICVCENKLLIDNLHQHRNQIMDFIQLKCTNDNSTLYSVSLEICLWRYPLAFGGVFIALLIAAVLLWWRYSLEVKIFLYSNNWCLFCLREEEVDADRPYDAFLSFAHGDDEYALQDLLPKLESEPYFYRICMHYRDWVVGDWIPRQVSRSVRLSKRTIIILSRNFVASQWGGLEFRYAVAGAAQSNRPRLIVLVLDDVLNEPLTKDMQDYISMNTYMHCQDPWFWQKLSYAMPHRQTFISNRAVNHDPPVELFMEAIPN